MEEASRRSCKDICELFTVVIGRLFKLEDTSWRLFRFHFRVKVITSKVIILVSHPQRDPRRKMACQSNWGLKWILKQFVGK